MGLHIKARNESQTQGVWTHGTQKSVTWLAKNANVVESLMKQRSNMKWILSLEAATEAAECKISPELEGVSL